MPGKTLIKVPSILMLIGGVVGLVMYLGAGLLLGYATESTDESMGWILVAVALAWSVVAILQIIAAIKGIKGCDNKQMAPSLKKWGITLIVLAAIAGVANYLSSTMSGEPIGTAAINIAVGFVLPIFYTWGAVKNENA